MRENRERKVPRLKKVSLKRWKRKSVGHWQLQTALRSRKDLQITWAVLDQLCTCLCREEYCVTKSEAFAVVTEQQTPERTRPMSRTASLRKTVMGKKYYKEKTWSRYPGARATANHAKIPGIATQRIVLLGPNLDERNWNRQVDLFLQILITSPHNSHQLGTLSEGQRWYS